MSFVSTAISSLASSNVLGLIGTGLQVFGQLRQGQQQSQAYNFNAQVAQQRAQLAKESGRLQIERQRRDASKFSATQRAKYAKAGVRLAGSPMEVLVADAAELEHDAMILDFNTRIAMLNAESDSSLNLFKAQQAETSSFLNAGTTLLTAIPRVRQFIRAS